MKKIYTFLIAFALIHSTFAQDAIKLPKTPIGGRPNIPSDLVFEFGFNQLNNRPEALETSFFGSRTFNVYLQHPIPVGGKISGLTINPGIGIGTDKLAFNKDENLFNNPLLGPESSILREIEDVYGDDIVVYTNVVATNYIEVPLDITYHLNKTNYSKGFRFSVGGKIGYLYNAHTKNKIEDSDGLRRKIKDSQNYGFEKFRYGVSVKAGSPGFYAWGYFGLNDLFQPGKGPFATQASQINFGIAINVF